MNRKPLVLGILGVALAVFAVAAWYGTRPVAVVGPPPVPPAFAEALVRSHAPVLGRADAPVTIVEFFDPACEACRAFHPIVKSLLAEHGDAVRVVIRYTPFHGELSDRAIRVLEAARMQGAFEPVLEALLVQQPRWAAHATPRPDLILPIAVSAGLDAAAAATQMLSPMVVGVLNRDRADVQTVGVRQTPTFFVNGRPLQPFGERELRALVAAEVAAARRSRPAGS